MKKSTAILATSLSLLFMSTPPMAKADNTQKLFEKGRYLIATAGCNDCHTDGYIPAEGLISETEWLTGTSIGFQGPWGTTYPSNLRLLMSKISEQQWMEKARSPMRPPMPWFNLSKMTDQDLKAIYTYVRKLGPKGSPVPDYVAPGEKVATPYFEFVPKNLPKLQASK